MPAFKPKIMVVDDEKDGREALAHLLRFKGYEVTEAATGGEVFRRAKTEWPSLIILDVVLPDILGTKVLEQLKADPVTKGIPVLLLTAKPDGAREMSSLPEDAARTIEKPGEAGDILKAVQEMLKGER